MVRALPLLGAVVLGAVVGGAAGGAINNAFGIGSATSSNRWVIAAVLLLVALVAAAALWRTVRGMSGRSLPFVRVAHRNTVRVVTLVVSAVAALAVVAVVMAGVTNEDQASYDAGREAGQGLARLQNSPSSSQIRFQCRTLAGTAHDNGTAFGPGLGPGETVIDDFVDGCISAAG